MFWKKTPPEKGGETGPRYDIFTEKESKTPRKIAIILAILVHLVLFLIIFPKAERKIFDKTDTVYLRPLIFPPPNTGLSKAPSAKSAPKPAARAKKEKVVPIPDPTPEEPEPIVEPEKELETEMVKEIKTEISLGDITAPPNESRGGIGKKESGGESGTGNEIFKEGAGGGKVIPPSIIAKPLPAYTEEARKNRTEGVVRLHVLIGKNGNVEKVEVIQSLDPELDKSALEMVKNNWRFRPATLDGKPVLFEAVIEIIFRLL